MQITPKDRNMPVTLSVVKYECHGEEQYDQLATCKSSERYEAAERGKQYSTSALQQKMSQDGHFSMAKA
jgi:hypothetical protein